MIDWKIRGAESQTIFGTAYRPHAAPVGCAIVAHGFKGYKDFRMIPPILAIHGENDETVDISNAESIAAGAKSAWVARIKNCNHVLNTPNPPPTDFRQVPELSQAIDEIVKVSRDCCTAQ